MLHVQHTEPASASSQKERFKSKVGTMSCTSHTPMLTVRELAPILKLTPQHINRMCAGGQIKAVKVERGWRISAQEVDRIQKDGLQRALG